MQAATDVETILNKTLIMLTGILMRYPNVESIVRNLHVLLVSPVQLSDKGFLYRYHMSHFLLVLGKLIKSLHTLIDKSFTAI